MSAMTFPSTGLDDAVALVDRLRAKFGPLATVIALHAALFYLLSSGLLDRVAQVALPQAVYVSFVTPPPPPKAPPPAAPKTVSLAPPPTVAPPPPVVQIAPVQNTITLPPPAPAAAPEKAAVVVAAVAPAAPPSTGPKTVTSDVEYIQPPQPVYPAQSKRLGEQGKVVLRVLVNEKGQADQVIVQSSSGSARLDEAGRQAALRARFKPYVENGHPVAVFVIVPLNFELAS
jgi:periplasmic protein TonB